MKITRGNLKNIKTLVYVVIGLLISVIFIVASFTNQDTTTSIASLIFITLFLTYLYYQFCHIILISEKGIQLITLPLPPQKKDFIRWDELKYFGLRTYTGRYRDDLSMDNRKKTTLGFKTICLSRHPASISLSQQHLGRDYITFTYRESAFAFIRDKLQSVGQLN